MRDLGFPTLALAMALGLGGCAAEARTPQELTLKQNLGVLRQVIEQFKADNQRFPESLESLVEAKYLIALPCDTVTESRDTWIEVREPGEGMVGVRSGAKGVASDGTRYFDW